MLRHLNQMILGHLKYVSGGHPRRSANSGRARPTRSLCGIAVAALGAALMLSTVSRASASSNESTSSSASVATKALTLQVQQPPSNLNPAKGDQQTYRWYVNLAYDSLIFVKADGSLEPRLAASWKYTDDTNTTFELTLREGVKFSNGSPLTAEGVKAHLEYYFGAGGTNAKFFTAVKSIDVVDGLTLRLNMSRPTPYLPILLAQNYGAGNVISPEALANPDALSTMTEGAGPYVLDRSQSVDGDHYVYTPNPNYWDPAGIHYTSITIKVIPNTDTALAALKTGQVDVVTGDFTVAGSAKADGFQIAFAPTSVFMLNLTDRGGELVPALANVRVRQAINYAIDRDAIAKLYGEYGIVSDQIALPGSSSSVGNRFYNYDPEKAKQLLSEAGYANGFTMSGISTRNLSSDKVLQAVAANLQKVGITMKLRIARSTADLVTAMTGKTVPAFIGAPSAPTPYLMGALVWGPGSGGSIYNPFGSTDDELISLYDQASAASERDLPALEQKIVTRLSELAWMAPLVFAPASGVYIASKDVEGIEVGIWSPVANPVRFRPAS